MDKYKTLHPTGKHTYFCITARTHYHKHSISKQYKFIILQFYRSEVHRGLSRLNSGTGTAFLTEVSGGEYSPWPIQVGRSQPCSCRTKVPISLLPVSLGLFLASRSHPTFFGSWNPSSAKPAMMVKPFSHIIFSVTSLTGEISPFERAYVLDWVHWIVWDNLSISRSVTLNTFIKLFLPVHKFWTLGHRHLWEAIILPTTHSILTQNIQDCTHTLS